MASTTFFANRGTITPGGPSGLVPTAVSLGVVKDVELTVSAEHVPLYGWGSILRQGIAKHSLKVAVKIGYCKFNPVCSGGGTAAEWFFSIGASPNVIPDGTIVDTNAVHLFDVDAEFVGEDGVKLHALITDVYYPDLPLKASEGQWVRIDMSGEGKTVVFTNPV
jgi:hypothetical protein